MIIRGIYKFQIRVMKIPVVRLVLHARLVLLEAALLKLINGSASDVGSLRSLSCTTLKHPGSVALENDLVNEEILGRLIRFLKSDYEQ